MSVSIYQLSAEWQELMEMLCDEEMDEQVILDTLEGIEGEIEDKADNYAKIIRAITAEAEALKAEEERLHARRKSREQRAANLKNILQANLELIGKTKFKTALFSFSVATNGGQQPLVISDDLSEIPTKYLIPQAPVPDKNKIRELLQEKEVEWAHLEPRGKTLRIR